MSFVVQKKVDPSLKVDIKLSSYHSRADVERMKRRVAAGEFWRKKELQDSYRYGTLPVLFP